jgi:hypothetical protein
MNDATLHLSVMMAAGVSGARAARFVQSLEAEGTPMSTRTLRGQAATMTIIWSIWGAASAWAQAVARAAPVATGERSAASDDERPPPPDEDEPSSKPARGAREHDGLLLRMALGPSYSKAVQDIDPGPIPRPTGPGTGLLPNLRSTESGSLSVGGEGMMASADLGAAAESNLIVFLRAAISAMLAPSTEGRLRDVSDGTLTSYLVGIGLTYYVMPVNVGFTLAGGLVATDFEYVDQGSETSADTDLGVGLQADLGKEFWVSDDWALGLTGRFMFESSPDSSAVGRTALRVLGGALLLGVTYQ